MKYRVGHWIVSRYSRRALSRGARRLRGDLRAGRGRRCLGPPRTILDELSEALAKATSGEWNTGPTTAAGEVWVYSDGEPIGEPAPERTGYRAWFRIGFGRKVRDPSFTRIQNIRAQNAENDALSITLLHNHAEALLQVARAAAELRTALNECLDCEWCGWDMGRDGEFQKLCDALRQLDPRLVWGEEILSE